MGNASVRRRSTVKRGLRTLAMSALLALLASGFVAVAAPASAASGSPCGASVNPIVCENQKSGTDPAVWDISGAGDPSIQGFATDISVNAGQRIDFKIDTNASAYSIDVYRTGWYQGLGARFITSVPVSATLPQHQPQCISDVATELYDCGTWRVSASWTVPTDAVSGVYVAKLTRADTGGASHIIFIVRKDGNTSDVLFQTSDPTWQAYNTYGGSDFYQGAANGRAFKISYNRPFATRSGTEARDFYFSSEYATVRFMERNGYDMSYIAGVDTDRRGAELRKHKVFLSVGHDEYWSGAQRKNMEAARDAGVNLQFLTGNEGYWRTRYEASADGSSTPYRTLVSYKETWSNQKIDPSAEWTGTWRDPRFAAAAAGGTSPENALTGTMYMVNNVAAPVSVTSEEGKLRLWRNAGLSSIPSGESEALGDQTVGYESDEDIDNGFRPKGLIRLSTTVAGTQQYLRDYGNVVSAGTTEHHITLYKAASGALVFSAGSVQWGWGLDSTHDVSRPAADSRMQQAQVNLLADMGAQPGTLMSGLSAASKSTDSTAPVTTITSPTEGQALRQGQRVTVTGTASDAAGRVAGVEVSTDGGASWHPAQGTTAWSYSYIQQGSTQATILARAIDDSANFSATGVKRTVAVSGPYSAFGEEVPSLASSSDTQAVELGLRFSPSSNGYVTGVRFYKGAANLGTHVGSLWDHNGQRLATVTFVGETSTGWQSALFSTPVQVTAGTSYTVSYTAPQGGYAFVDNYWPYLARTSSPVTVASGVGANSPGLYGHAGELPTYTWGDSNYYVDPIFETTVTSTVRIAARQPANGASSVPVDADVTAVFTGTVTAPSLTVKDPGGTSVAGTVSYNATTKTVRFAPAAPLTPSTLYKVTISATPSGGASFDDGGAWTFTTAAPVVPEGQCPCSIYTDLDRPLISADSDPDAVTLGTRFRVTTAGVVTGVRFYKGLGNGGIHVGALWTSDGQQLGAVNFQNESTSGWQTASFATPIAVQPGVDYIVSYNAPGGHYAVAPSGFADGYTRGPITVPVNGGVFTYGSGAPQQTTSTSYFVDVVLETTVAGPMITSSNPASGATDVARGVSPSATFSEALTSTPTMVVKANGASVSGTASLSSDRKTVIFAPASPLPYGATVVVALSGIRGASGDGTDRTWSFVVVADPSSTTYTLLGAETPAVSSVNDGTTVQLGMTFSSSVDGRITALRFFKATGDSGTHTGVLWSSTGQRLATVEFQNETASGWQRAILSNPVAVTAGSSYTVSYVSSQGRYVTTGDYFSTAKVSGPLTAASGVNGVYRYDDGATMPTASFHSSNYFVDVEFMTGTSGEEAVAVASGSPKGSGVPVDSNVTVTLTKGAPSPSIVVKVGGTTVAGTSSYDALAKKIMFVPTAPLAQATTYSVEVRIDGQALDQWTFTTAEPVLPGSTDTIFGTETPQTAAAADADAVEVGTAFTVTRAGQVTAIRFYKGSGNGGTHVGHLWDSAGNLLAAATFESETSSGWQRAVLSSPVAVSTGQTYVVSYLAPTGRYSITGGYFGSAKTSGSIVAPSGNNGRFTYGAGGGFPVGSWNSSAYFVDAEIVFGGGNTSPTPSPAPSASTSPSASAAEAPAVAPTEAPAPAPVVTITARSPQDGATDAAPTAPIVAIIGGSTGSASLALMTGSATVSGASAYDPASRTVTFTPTAPLNWSTTYTATVSATGATVENPSWSFTTSAAPQVADVTTMFGNSSPLHPAWDDPDGVQVSTRFTVDVAGQARGVRFYKGDANTGEHTGYLWSADGTQLAEVVFADETVDGWQTAQFTASVDLAPGTEYRVGLYSTTGRYAVDPGTLAGATSVGHFAIPESGSAWVYSKGFPSNLSTNNYWIDVLFDPRE